LLSSNKKRPPRLIDEEEKEKYLRGMRKKDNKNRIKWYAIQ
jgi:hypothetical protein